MALIQMGQLASQARGSIGGTVYSRNLGGAYVRNRTAPVNRRTPAQTAVRANFAANAKAWSGTLTTAQRAAWTLFAQNNPYTNILGASIILSGLAMYQSLNRVLNQISAAAISDAPADLTVPALATVESMQADAGGGSVTFNTADQAVVADAKYYIFATGPLAPGKLPPNNAYRYMAAIPPTALGDSLDITSQWETLFGTLAAGVAIGGRVATVNTLTGAVTPALTFSCVST